MHTENAETSIEVTLSGIVTEVKPVHPENAPTSIEVTLFGIVMDVRLAHCKNVRSPIEVGLPEKNTFLISDFELYHGGASKSGILPFP